MSPFGHKNSPTQNPEMCSQRCVQQKEPQSAHSKWSCRRSLSIAVAVASSTAVCTDVGACEDNNPPAHGSRGAVGGERRSKCAGRQRRMDECRGPPAQTHPMRPRVLDPGRGPGKLPTRSGASRQPMFQTQFQPSSTSCGHALIELQFRSWRS